MSASSTSFICVIFFDDFNKGNFPPVFLTCGHTYVYASCANILKNCMECRTSLFVKLPAGDQKSLTGIARRNVTSSSEIMMSVTTSFSRTSYHTGNMSNNRNIAPIRSLSYQIPNVTDEPIRSPLPKNLVVVQLMEAAKQGKRK